LELCSIKREDIRDGFILINGKNNKQRAVPITPILKKALARYDRAREGYFRSKSTDDYYFLSFSGRMLNNGAIDYMIKKRGAGIEGIRVSPHTCRHFFAQQQIRMGVDIYTISRLLGHENVSITQIYLNSLNDADIVRMAKSQSVLMNL
jgi:integrase/recombinase XerD